MAKKKRRIPAKARQARIIEESDDIDDYFPESYSITTYGADMPVDGLVKRVGNNVIDIPTFQRGYVWTQPQASQFVESLLLGLPVPSIFLWKEAEHKFLVVDGQQRLLTLKYFFDGIFSDTGREFQLRGVQPRLDGLTFKSLSPPERARLENALIHAIFFKQDLPSDDGNSSMFHVFHRLNSGGTLLEPQEIRAAIFNGALSELLRTLNSNEKWQEMFGVTTTSLRDQELILRFFALLYRENYAAPMKRFLNDFMAKNRDLQLLSKTEMKRAFEGSIRVLHEAVGPDAFRPERAFNAAVFDAVMVGLARRVVKGAIGDVGVVKQRHSRLLKNSKFIEATSRATARPENVRTRLDLATDAFADVK